MALDKCILYLDEKFAKLRNNEETVCVQKAIEEAVSALVRSVGEQDARFLGKIEPSGSFYEGTKILQPDQNSTLSLRFLDSRSFVISCTRGGEDLIIFWCGFVQAKRMICGIRV